MIASRVLLALRLAAAQVPPMAPPAVQQIVPPAAQHPSPMVETTRRHERLAQRPSRGTMRSFAGPAGKPVEVLVPDRAGARGTVDLVVHFHGAAWVAQQSAAAADRRAVVAVVNLGAGSGAYHRAFTDPAAFDTLLVGILREVSAVTSASVRVGRVTLTGFSAGHGAIRVILREPRHVAKIDGVLLIDGMHTSYVPEGKVLETGATLDTTNLSAFAAFARAAMGNEKRFVVTHTEIFPGTFASTTETADWLIASLGLRRTPVLRWGPRGTQQLSEVRAGRFELLGFAGNSAPDHSDQFDAMPELLRRVIR